ncbi:bile acid:sodium symporter family protein [Shimia marina]|uniref:Bile acid transporter n=1 Tax=Shimia marina TaxID=321267 RepID=A0A0P1EUM7_9RHOB|nr:bile acid:sodium symporter family protein [Shimia marina]CUH54061.1 bile acid transporter [Shimia marina]SFE59410.1 bile acid:Na+ symporter, BASS family [Shimia marina]
MLVEVALPLSLAVIMFSLGFGLTFADFGRVLTMPKAVITGMVMQMLAVPLVALILVSLTDLPPALAFGVLLLSFCPGGVTSNILTKLAGGTVALSITLTAIVSLLSVITVPLLTSLAGRLFLDSAVPQINVTSIAISMFSITTVPVMIGLLLRFVAPQFAVRHERQVSLVAAVLFVSVLVAAVIVNVDVLVANMGTLGPILVALNATLLILGVVVARGIGLSGADGLCIAVEMSVQNGTLGIAVAGIVAQSGGIPDFAVPSAVYGVIVYVTTFPVVFVLRRIFGKT